MGGGAYRSASAILEIRVKPDELAAVRRSGWLALRELRRLASLVQAGLLALDDARVARQEAGALQRHAQLGVCVDKCARDPVTHGTGLAARPAALHADTDVVASLETRDLQRRERGLPMRGPREVLLDRATVEPRRPVAGPEDDTCDRRIALAGTEVLRDLAHLPSNGSGFGTCASCGCSGPA